MARNYILCPIEESRVLSVQWTRNPSDERERSHVRQPDLQGSERHCAVVGAIALLGTFFLTVTGGSPYLQFALALIFFAMFIVGSYWWMVFGPGSKL